MWCFSRSLRQFHDSVPNPAADERPSRRRVQSTAAAPLQPIQLAQNESNESFRDPLNRPALDAGPSLQRPQHPSPNHSHKRQAATREDPARPDLRQGRNPSFPQASELDAFAQIFHDPPAGATGRQRPLGPSPLSSTDDPGPGPGSSSLRGSSFSSGFLPYRSAAAAAASQRRPVPSQAAPNSPTDTTTSTTANFLDVEPLILAMVGNRLPVGPLQIPVKKDPTAAQSDKASIGGWRPEQASPPPLASPAQGPLNMITMQPTTSADGDETAELLAAAAAAVASAAAAAIYGAEAVGSGVSNSNSSSSGSSGSGVVGVGPGPSWVGSAPAAGGWAPAATGGLPLASLYGSPLYGSPQALLAALDLVPPSAAGPSPRPRPRLGLRPQPTTWGPAGSLGPGRPPSTSNAFSFSPTAGTQSGWAAPAASAGPSPSSAARQPPVQQQQPQSASGAFSSGGPAQLFPERDRLATHELNSGLNRGQGQGQGQGHLGAVLDGLLATLIAPSSPLRPAHRQQHQQHQQQQQQTEHMPQVQQQQQQQEPHTQPELLLPQGASPRQGAPSMAPVTARGREAAALVFAAAGTALPPWAQGRSAAAAPPSQSAGQEGSGAAAGLGSRQGSVSGPRLDPALDWALGVLSPRVTPLEPSARDLGLANRTLAAHLGQRWDDSKMTRGSGTVVSGRLRAVDRPVTAGAPAAALMASSETGASDPWDPLTQQLQGPGAPGVWATAAGRIGGSGPRAGAFGVGTGSRSVGSSMDLDEACEEAAAGARGGAGGPLLPWPLLLPLLGAVGERLSPSTAAYLLRGLASQVGRSWRSALSPRQQAHLAATLKALLGAALRKPELVHPPVAAGILCVLSYMRIRSVPICTVLVDRVLLVENMSSTVFRSKAAAHAAAAAAAPSSTATAAAAGASTREDDGERPTAGPRVGARLSWVLWALAAVAGLGRAFSQQLPRKTVYRLLRLALLDAERWTPASTAALLAWSARLRHRPNGHFMRVLEARLLQGDARPQSSTAPPSTEGCRLRWRVRAGQRLLRQPLMRWRAVQPSDRAVVADRQLRSGAVLGLEEDPQDRPTAAAAAATQLETAAVGLGRSSKAAVMEAVRPPAAGPVPGPGRGSDSGSEAAVSVLAPPGACSRWRQRQRQRHEERLARTAVWRAARLAARRPGGGGPAAAVPVPVSGGNSSGVSSSCSSGRLLGRMKGCHLATVLQAMVVMYGEMAAVKQSKRLRDGIRLHKAPRRWRWRREGGLLRAARRDRRQLGGTAAALGPRAVATGSGFGSAAAAAAASPAAAVPEVILNTFARAPRRLEGPSSGVVLHLATSMLRRLSQLRPDQLCRLPLLLRLLRYDAASHGPRLPQSFYDSMGRHLGGCDGVDLMLLLRGMAATVLAEAAEAAAATLGSAPSASAVIGAPAAVAAVAAAPPAQPAATVTGPTAGVAAAAAAQSAGAAALGSTAAVQLRRRRRRRVARMHGGKAAPRGVRRDAAACQDAELADEAVRQYLALLPAVPDQLQLHHTAVVIESAAVLWTRHHNLLRGRGSLAASSSPSSAVTAARGGPPPPLPPSPPPEADLAQRRLADLVSEREFLLQQLEEHVARCLARGGSAWGAGGVSGGGSGGGRKWDPRKGGADTQAAARRAKLAVKLLGAYSCLQRPPPARLQAELECAVVGGSFSLGASSWGRVRAAYQRLGLQPGRDLSVALVTFG